MPKIKTRQSSGEFETKKNWEARFKASKKYQQLLL